MQEFSSVTASSYDAASLAPLLNEKAADGWSVVSIVTAGTNIVAYLQREAGEHAADAAPATEVPEVEDIAVTAVDETPSPVAEPAGWATAPEEQTTEIETAETEPVAEPVIEPVDEPVIEPVDEPVAEPVVEPVDEPAPVSEPAVPAGWYADPSRRFELRYWDGAAWTEHVSRAGQQFTDPPVA
jgi:hypothetical protein